MLKKLSVLQFFIFKLTFKNSTHKKKKIYELDYSFYKCKFGKWHVLSCVALVKNVTFT